ncbi:MAG TPA: alpha/beta fold hydrolase [Polyangiaceae bacterium]|nr:alpha/beta fold hydrolase [Polyangiaceae bacterium]
MLRSHKRGGMVAISVLVSACAGNANVATWTPPCPAAAPSTSSDLAPILPESASPIGFADMAKYPEPGWQIPRAPKLSPDGRMLTYLMSEEGDQKMALFAIDLVDGAAAKPRVLVRAADLAAEGRGPSLEEELRNERQRKRIEGITDYSWAPKTGAIVIPAGGDLFVRGEGGKIVRVTDTPEPELDPKLSPDASKVAFVRGDDVFVADVASRKITRPFRSAPPSGTTRGQSDFNHQEEFDEPSGLFWSSDGSRLVALEVDESRLATIPVLGYRGGKTDLMMQRYPLAGTLNPVVKVRVVDVRSHKESLLELPPSVPGDAYIGRLRFLPDGESFLCATLDRAQKTLAIVLAAPGTGRSSRVVARFAATKGWVEVGDLEVSPDGKRAFALGPSEGRQRVFEIDLAGDADQGTAKVHALTTGSGDDQSIVGYDETKQRLLFTSTEGDPIGRQLYAVGAGGAIERLTKEPGFHEVVMAPKSGAWLDLSSSHTAPPKVVLHAQADIVVPLPRDGDLERLPIRAPELVEANGADGTKLYGAVLSPRNLELGKRYPLLLVVYGGPGVQMIQDRWGPRLLWQHLADRGFFVAQFDNRGGSGRGYDFATPIAGALGKVELADQLAVVDELTKKYPIDRDRLAIYGHSYGGFMAIQAMLRAPDRFRVGIAGSPVTDWRLYDSGYTERFMGNPQINAAGYDASELTALAPALKGHLFVIHALMDENVHFQNTADLVTALVAAEKPFDMFVFPGERHGYHSPATKAYAMQLVTRYLTEHLAKSAEHADSAPNGASPPSP